MVVYPNHRSESACCKIRLHQLCSTAGSNINAGLWNNIFKERICLETKASDRHALHSPLLALGAQAFVATATQEAHTCNSPPVWRGRGEAGHLAGEVWALSDSQMTSNNRLPLCLLPQNCNVPGDPPNHPRVNNTNRFMITWLNLKYYKINYLVWYGHLLYGELSFNHQHFVSKSNRINYKYGLSKVKNSTVCAMSQWDEWIKCQEFIKRTRSSTSTFLY